MKDKKECERCHKKFRKLNLCRDGKLRCTTCMRWYSNNKFYIPLKERKNLNERISKYNINENEKKKLHNKFIGEGLSSEDAWKKVHFHCYILKNLKRKNRKINKMNKNKEIESKLKKIELNKNFVEGLSK
jgi:hypothetical protein